MRYFQAVLELLCLLLICLILGRRILDLGPTWIKRKFGLYVAPGLGLAALLGIASLYGRIAPFHWSGSLSLMFILSGLALIFEPKKKELWRHSRCLCLIALITSLPVLAPELRYGGYSPFTDIFTYLTQSQWLQFHAFSEKIFSLAYHPALTQVTLYQATGARMGGTFFLGFVQSLFRLAWSYDAYLPTVSLGVVIGCCFVGGIVRQVVPLKPNVILALLILPAILSNGFVYGAEWGFFPQTYGLAFAFGLCALLPPLVQHVLRVELKWGQYFRFAFPVALCSAAMLLAYNEPFPLFLGAIGLFMMFMMFIHPAHIKVIFVLSFVLLIELMLLVNMELVRLIHNLYQTLTISGGALAIGWPVLWSPIRFLAFSFGISSYFNQFFSGFDDVTSFIVMPILLIFLFYLLARFMQNKPKRCMVLGLIFCFEFVLWCFFIKFRYFSINNAPMAVGQTFLQFKIAKYASPFSLSLLAIGGGILWFYYKAARRSLILIYALIIMLGLFYHVLVVSKYFTTPFLNSVQRNHTPFEVLLKLRRAIQTIPQNEVIDLALGPEQMKLKQLLTYILWDRPVSGNFQDDVYLAGQLSSQKIKRQTSTWVLLMANEPHMANLEISSPPFILRKQPFLFAIPAGQQGGYSTEVNAKGETFSWVEHAIDMKFNIQGNAQSIALKCLLSPKGEKPRTFRVQFKMLSGKILATYILNDLKNPYVFNTPWLPTGLKKHFILHVEADGKPIKLGHFDQRRASFMISNVSISLSPLSTEQVTSRQEIDQK